MTEVIAVRAYPKLVWHYRHGDPFWSLCGRWMATLSAVQRPVPDIPTDEPICKRCARRLNKENS